MADVLIRRENLDREAQSEDHVRPWGKESQGEGPQKKPALSTLI